MLNISVAALEKLYEMLQMPNPCNNDIKILVSAIVKTRTQCPRQRVPLLPVDIFYQLFLSWEAASSVSSVLNEAIGLVGLDTNMYSAKSFRLTAATGP